MDILNENITKAQQTVNLLVSDLRLAYAHINNFDRPEGLNRRDRALEAWLGKLMQDARQMESDLQKLGGE